MRAWLVVVLVLAYTASGLPARSTVVAATHPKVIVTPSEGHSGDTAYLSGAGFPPNRKLNLSLGCPTARANYTDWFEEGDARADRHGQFVAHMFRTPSLPRGARCSMYADVGRAHGIMASASAIYSVVPGNRPLRHCAAHMCLIVKGFLVRIKSGVSGHIEVHGWPGATATVTVQAPGRPVEHKVDRLDWQGIRTFKMLVAPGLRVGLKARIQVRARLGRVFGRGTGRFIVIPGGR